jgi:hypothetical protein
VIVTSPRTGDDLKITTPRLLVAWPAGNSGIYTLSAPGSGQDGTLAMTLDNSSRALDPMYEAGGANSCVGVSAAVKFNDSAILTVPILGSIRSIRDYTEGGRKIDQTFQNSFGFSENSDGSASVNRTWFDGVATTTLKLTPLDGAKKITINREAMWMLSLGQGTYRFEASFNYPQLEQLSPEEVFNAASKDLIAQNPDQTTSLSFLSYKGKLLAGTWRFLTYFGRDSILSMLLLQSFLAKILSKP